MADAPRSAGFAARMVAFVSTGLDTTSCVEKGSRTQLKPSALMFSAMTVSSLPEVACKLTVGADAVVSGGCTEGGGGGYGALFPGGVSAAPANCVGVLPSI